MEKRSLRLALLTLFSICLLAVGFPKVGFGQDQDNQEIALEKAKQLLKRLSPEERVGQLFLLTFDGTEIKEGSPIFELITNYHISGVVLKRANDNFNDESILENTYSLIRGLQEIEWQSRDRFVSKEANSSRVNYIPLFVGISQSGDSYPTDQILSELTPLPSQMAIGATWNTDYAQEAGKILGQELSSLGFNMVFGPSLDVIENPYGEGKGDLGVRTFGGDPFWVGEFSRAYIYGLHAGSDNRLAVIAKNFPGRGSSDRLPDEEVATVRKSIEQLKLIELAPFFAVTDTENLTDDFLVDGLLLSHIRYQGFQGNIRATTRPVSFDQSAVELLMNLPLFSAWRARGGILVSDDLGSQAVRKFFSPTDQLFDGRQIARNAFLSGNDLLYIDQLISSKDSDRYQTYKATIEQFIQKYGEDRSFAEKVDMAVLHILALKYCLYPEFNIDTVSPDQQGLDIIGQSSETVFAIIGKAASLISPKSDQISEVFPEAPASNDQMIIFTDALSTTQCNGCPNKEIVPVDGLEKAVMRLYGPSGSGQIADQNIISYSFDELQNFIDNPFNRLELETNLSRAKWVIFLVHDQNPERPGAYALHNLLSKKSEVLKGKSVLVFALNAPYYYDATEISAFSAYYALYSKTPPAYEVIARILFKELVPSGSSPVSIPGVAYNLIDATSPNPNQVIALFVDEQSEEGEAIKFSNSINGQPKITDYVLGDNIPIRTSVILDHNNNPVPDGTVVKFSLSLQGESLTIQQVDATTKEGVARASFKLLTGGLHEIRAISEPALNSQILILEISEGQGAVVSAITPTPFPTMESEKKPSEETPILEPESEPISEKDIKVQEWLLVTAFTWLSGIIFFSRANFIKQRTKRLTMSGAIVVGGLLFGYWLIFNLPGSFQRVGWPGFVALIGVTIIGSLLGGLTAGFFGGKKG